MIWDLSEIILFDVHHYKLLDAKLIRSLSYADKYLRDICFDRICSKRVVQTGKEKIIFDLTPRPSPNKGEGALILKFIIYLSKIQSCCFPLLRGEKKRGVS